MVCRYLLQTNSPHKAFVARMLALLLAEHRLLPSSALMPRDMPAAPSDDALTAPAWDFDNLLMLHQGMIQRVHRFKLKLGFQAVAPYFRPLFSIGAFIKPVVRCFVSSVWFVSVGAGASAGAVLCFTGPKL